MKGKEGEREKEERVRVRLYKFCTYMIHVDVQYILLSLR